MVVSLGPQSPVMNNVPKNPGPMNAGSNPRCMRRDVNVNAALGATANISYNLLTKSNDINTFYNTLLTPPRSKEPYNWGIHTSGHYIAGGDPGGDPFTSPGDPIFYFHHAMLDRLWWIWQMQDPDTRLNAQVNLGGKPMPTMAPGHEHGDGGTGSGRILDLKWLMDDTVPVLHAHDSLGGHNGAFCHIYV